MRYGLGRRQPHGARFLGLNLLNAQNDVDRFEFGGKGFNDNALPLAAVVFEDDIGWVMPSPFVVGKAEIRGRHDIGRTVQRMHGQQVEICAAYVLAVFTCLGDDLA